MPFSELNFKPAPKRGKPVNLANIPQEKLYIVLRPVTKEKKKDMQDLLRFIPPIHHPYFRSLLTSDDATDIGPLDAEEINY